MKKITYLFILFAGLPALMLAQCPGTPPAGYTCIPDANFESRLIALGFDNSDTMGDDVVDGLLDNAEAASISTTDLVLNNQGIADFTGIEAFVNILTLNINDNTTATIDLTGNTLLTGVSALRCGATSIDLTGLTALTTLSVRECALTSIDLSTNTALDDLDVSRNALTALDLSNNLALTTVACGRQSSTGGSPFNELINIDLNGVDRSNLTSMDANFNYMLTCVYVDDPDASTYGWSLDTSIPAAYCTGSLGTEDRRVSSFSMYPNPTKNLVLIGSRTQNSTLNVYSISGKLVLSKELSFGDNNVNITSLSSGIYLARFTAENRTETKKLVIN